MEVDYGTDDIAALSNTDLEVVHNTGKIASPRCTVVDTVALDLVVVVRDGEGEAKGGTC